MSEDEEATYDELSKKLDGAFRDASEAVGLSGIITGWVISWEVVDQELEDGYTKLRNVSSPGQQWSTSRGLIEAVRDHYKL